MRFVTDGVVRVHMLAGEGEFTHGPPRRLVGEVNTAEKMTDVFVERTQDARRMPALRKHRRGKKDETERTNKTCTQKDKGRDDGL